MPTLLALVRLDPFPPPDDYRALRPADRRAAPPVELLPMVSEASESEGSILAVVFPYTPVGCRTSLVMVLPEGASLRSAVELWSGRDWTARVEPGEDGAHRIPLEIPGDLDLLALQIRYDGPRG